MAPVRRWLLANSLLASLLLHGLLFGGALGYIRWQESRTDNAMEIDLRGQSLLTRPADLQGGQTAAHPPEPWYLASGSRVAPPPKLELSPTAKAAEAEGPVCPAPCPERAGDWVPAAAASRQPVLPEGTFTEDDYPASLRRQGKSGRVLVELLIDAGGAVRSVTLLQSSLPEFNEVVVRKLKAARFRPAYDANGDPIPCRYLYPATFQLD
jgi:TonB family protein